MLSLLNAQHLSVYVVSCTELSFGECRRIYCGKKQLITQFKKKWKHWGVLEKHAEFHNLHELL
jgi:hypothetical protein